MGQVVKMYIDKFKKVVSIEDDHPLAIAQKAKGGEVLHDPEPAKAPPEAVKGPNLKRMKKDELLALAREKFPDDLPPEDVTKDQLIERLSPLFAEPVEE